MFAEADSHSGLDLQCPPGYHICRIIRHTVCLLTTWPGFYLASAAPKTLEHHCHRRKWLAVVAPQPRAIVNAFPLQRPSCRPVAAHVLWSTTYELGICIKLILPARNRRQLCAPHRAKKCFHKPEKEEIPDGAGVFLATFRPV